MLMAHMRIFETIQPSYEGSSCVSQLVEMKVRSG